MTGRHGGVVTLVQQEAADEVDRVWCGVHQIDLATKAFISSLTGGCFYKTRTHAFSVHLRKQANLITSMQSTCLTDTSRWLAFAEVI
jgi:hypothetical protein